jgi:predicted DNA-binding protein
MSKTIAFRAPDELAQEIEDRAASTGQDKTAVIIEMVKGLPSIEVEKRYSLPEVEAIYLVWQLDKLLYIGQTDNLRQRFTDHPRLVEFLNVKAKIAWFSPEGCDRLEVESGLTGFLSIATTNKPTPASSDEQVDLTSELTQLKMEVAEIKKQIADRPPSTPAAPLVPKEPNQPPYKTLAALAASGSRAKAIAEELNTLGYTTAQGYPFTRDNLNSLIRSDASLKHTYDLAANKTTKEP